MALVRTPHNPFEQLPEGSVFLQGNILLHFYGVLRTKLDNETSINYDEKFAVFKYLHPFQNPNDHLVRIPGTTRVAPVRRPSPRGKRMAEEDIAKRLTARPKRVDVHVT